MTVPRSLRNSLWPAVLVLGAMLGAGGCHAVDFYEPTLQKPVPPPLEPPRELTMMSLPSYRVEPPDVLAVEMLKLVPLPPYRIDIYDWLTIRVLNTIIDQPIDNVYIVEGEGVVSLGPAYGTVRVVGMTIDEATEAITRKLKDVLADPYVSVQLYHAAGTQPVTGTYPVAPDGTINLRLYGTLHVAGKTITEIRLALQKQLSQYFDAPEPSVDVFTYASKVFYVIHQEAGMGDSVRRLSISGNETVLDAISAVGGLTMYSSPHIWIARPAPAEFGHEQILPVDYNAITQGAESATNFQILPGDRVYIAEDNVMAFNTFVAKVTAPLEKLLGTATLGTNAVRNMETMGRDYNRTRNL
jgi:polysaccharide biosynthesis/export protein